MYTDCLFTGNATTCRQIPHSSTLRDVEWATNTCTITFTTLGIWPESADGTDINHCDRSHDSKLLASGDDFGKVKLYSYPVIQPKVSISYYKKKYQNDWFFFSTVVEPCLWRTQQSRDSSKFLAWWYKIGVNWWKRYKCLTMDCIVNFLAHSKAH